MKLYRYWSQHATWLVWLLLVVMVAVLQWQIFLPHLKYGFIDVDWIFLYQFKTLPPASLQQVIGIWQQDGVYAYHPYFIGLQEMLHGMDFVNFHLTTWVVKFLSTISLYPLILIISGRRLLAFITTLVFAVAYPAIGAMFAIVTSCNYLALTSLNLWLTYYVWLVINQREGGRYLGILFGWFCVTLFLSTERLIPVLALILIGEGWWCWRQHWQRRITSASIKRLIVLFLPIITILVVRASTITGFSSNTAVIFHKIQQGNWQLGLTPLVSLGSLFVPHEFWNLLGVATVENWVKYWQYVLIGPMVVLGLVTLLLGWLLPVRWWRFNLVVWLIWIVELVLIDVMSTHYLQIPSSLVQHFDPYIIPPAIIGAYVLAFGMGVAVEWWQVKQQRLLELVLVGLVVAVVYIVITWIPSDPTLIVAGPHRYLTIPAIGSSLIIGVVLVMIYDYWLKRRLIGWVAPLVFLIIIPLIMIDSLAINNFFNYELYTAGMSGVDQTRMKSQLINSLTHFDYQQPSLYLLEISRDDNKNGYFHETAIVAAFDTWTMFRGDKVLDAKLRPSFLRKEVICPDLKQDCSLVLKKYLIYQNGQPKMLVNGQLFDIANFYAFRMKNLQVEDIRSETLVSMGLTP